MSTSRIGYHSFNKISNQHSQLNLLISTNCPSQPRSWTHHPFMLKESVELFALCIKRIHQMRSSKLVTNLRIHQTHTKIFIGYFRNELFPWYWQTFNFLSHIEADHLTRTRLINFTKTLWAESFWETDDE